MNEFMNVCYSEIERNVDIFITVILIKLFKIFFHQSNVDEFHIIFDSIISIK